MVQDTGKTAGAGVLRPVNIPEPVRVQENPRGIPIALRDPRRQAIVALSDRWRIDDEWWRGASVSRLYFAVVLDQGRRLTIFKDLPTGRWYRQCY